MTTPMSNVNYAGSKSYLGSEQLRAADGTVALDWDADPSFYHSRVTNMRPASINNPVRDDGTRAPSGWDSYWCNVEAPISHRAWSIDAGSGYRWHYTFAKFPGFTTPFGGGTPGLGAIGLGWINGVYGSTFPYGVESRAITKALTKLRGQKYSFGESLGELRDTAGLISDGAESVVQAVNGLAKRMPGSKSDLVEWLMSINTGHLSSARAGKPVRGMPWSIANRIWGRKAQAMMELGISAWLTYQFAVKPLFNDINDASNALGEILFGEHRRPTTVTVRTSVREREEVVTTLTGQMYDAWSATVGIYRTSTCKISATYDILSRSALTPQEAGLTNSFSVAWELLPFSWMVDYLTTAGEWIGTLAPVEGARFVEGSMTRFQDATPSRLVRYNPLGSTAFESGFQAQRLVLTAGRMERVVLPPYGLLPAYRPAFRNKMNLTRLANSLSALVNLAR